VRRNATREMLLDFKDRMLGQILVYLRNNAGFHIRMKCKPQFCEGSRRSHDNQLLHLAGPDKPFHGRGDRADEVMLLEFVPIGWLYL
jgi:hypothetical protein